MIKISFIRRHANFRFVYNTSIKTTTPKNYRNKIETYTYTLTKRKILKHFSLIYRLRV